MFSRKKKDSHVNTNFYAFLKCYFFCLCFNLNISGVGHFEHPQFATSYFLPWMPCYDRCKQRITVFGLWTYSNILTEGILLKMLRNKRELDLEQAIWFFCFASTFCSSHTDPNSHACLAIKFLNIYLFSRRICVVNCWVSAIKSTHRYPLLPCRKKKNLCNQLGVFVSMTAKTYNSLY